MNAEDLKAPLEFDDHLNGQCEDVEFADIRYDDNGNIVEVRFCTGEMCSEDCGPPWLDTAMSAGDLKCQCKFAMKSESIVCTIMNGKAGDYSGDAMIRSILFFILLLVSFQISMLENILLILVVNMMWLCKYSYIAVSGYPFMFVILCSAWYCKLLPDSAFHYELSVIALVLETILLVFVADGIQTIVHAALHKSVLKNTLLGMSHRVHHEHKTPKPEDAFYTGVLDSSIFITGTLMSIYLVCPSRTSLTLFGCLYSWWLQFIHSSPNIDYPTLRRIGLVTPKYHHAHHINPQTNFASVIAWL